MAYNIVYTPYAERDIWEIADNLSDYSIIAARRFLQKTKTQIESLADMPNRYPILLPKRAYRKLVVDNYIVVYSVREDIQQVTIVRVIHGMRNYLEEI